MTSDARHNVDQLLTVREAARRLRCSATNLYALIDGGVIPVVRVGKAKGYRIDCRDLRAFIDDRKRVKQVPVKTGVSPRPRLKHIRLR